ncbi:MAG: DUF2141 domain-containing protein [Planctomycetota bacterium]|nr:MAG: DUF2141 domain-containing protein [Planctomycetota bacterium]
MKRLFTICVVLFSTILLGNLWLIHKRPQPRPEHGHVHDDKPQPVKIPQPISSEQNPARESHARSSPAVLEREISVSISGLKSRPSNVFLAVYQSASDFPLPANSTKTVILPATDTLLTLSLMLLENHPIAIGVFQDLDGNGILTKNVIGIPTEPYGFTNNVRSSFGPPTFSQSVIYVDAETTSLEIRLQ